MALNPHLSVASRNLALNAALDVCNTGFIDIMSGSQPATADTAIGAQVVLAVLPLASTAFGAASSGSKTAGTITSDASADNTGTATWFRMYKSDHTTAVLDGSVGTSGCDLNLNSVALTAGSAVACSSFVVTMAA